MAFDQFKSVFTDSLVCLPSHHLPIAELHLNLLALRFPLPSSQYLALCFPDLLFLSQSPMRLCVFELLLTSCLRVEFDKLLALQLKFGPFAKKKTQLIITSIALGDFDQVYFPFLRVFYQKSKNGCRTLYRELF